MIHVASVLILWLVSLCLHEYGHARVAYAGGDTSVRDKGYLSMNPLAYVHPMTSIVFPLIILMLGGIPLPGGAVYIDISRLRSRHWEAAVSAAGPAANVAFLFLMGLPFYLDLPSRAPDTSLWGTLALTGMFQAAAIVLNLLPLPGLDGFGILAPYLPPSIRARCQDFSRYTFFILIGALVMNPSISSAFFGLSFRLVELAGIPFEPLQLGYRAFNDSLSSILPFRQ